MFPQEHALLRLLAASVSVGVPHVAALAAGQTRTAIRILQMDCPTEETLIRNVLGTMNAVHDLQFNLMQRVLTVVHRPDAINNVLQAVRKLGFQPEIAQSGSTPQTPIEPAKPWWPLAVAGVAALGAEAAHWSGAPQWAAAALALAAVAICGLGTYRKGWIALRHGNLNINAPKSIAVTGALLLVLLVGGSLYIDSWTWPAVGLALFLFVVARPLSVLPALVGSGASMRLRGMTAWFGVRGIGSLYYLMYAIEHGLPEPLALQLVQMTLIVVTLSILVHGTSVKPLMERFWKGSPRRGQAK